MSRALCLLNEYRNAVLQVEKIMSDIQTLRGQLELQSTSSIQERVASSVTIGDQMANTVCGLQSLLLDMLDALDYTENARRHTGNVIYLVRDKQQGQWEQVLTLRYIKRMSWRQIGGEMGSNRTTVQRWHDNAVGVIDGLLLQSGTPMC